MKPPPYTVPDEDKDLLGCGLVLTPERVQVARLYAGWTPTLEMMRQFEVSLSHAEAEERHLARCRDRRWCVHCHPENLVKAHKMLKHDGRSYADVARMFFATEEEVIRWLSSNNLEEAKRHLKRLGT